MLILTFSLLVLAIVFSNLTAYSRKLDVERYKKLVYDNWRREFGYSWVAIGVFHQSVLLYREYFLLESDYLLLLNRYIKEVGLPEANIPTKTQGGTLN